MTVTLTGSYAMSMWYPHEGRQPKSGTDVDYQSDKQFNLPDRLADGRRTDLFVEPRLAQWDWGLVATPDELYTMKISHAFWEINGSRNWDKHASDIIFLSRKGAEFRRELYHILLPIWKEKYRRNPVDTTKSKDEFFKDAVNRKYDHDSLHDSVAYGDRPLYESILKDGESVAVDNAKFWAMPLGTQLKVVREEVYATALERILIPGNYQGSPGAAYWWALRRTATSLFKGEWALFLLLNLDTLRKPDCDYMQRHLANKDKLILLGDKGDTGKNSRSD